MAELQITDPVTPEAGTPEPTNEVEALRAEIAELRGLFTTLQQTVDALAPVAEPVADPTPEPAAQAGEPEPEEPAAEEEEVDLEELDRQLHEV